MCFRLEMLNTSSLNGGLFKATGGGARTPRCIRSVYLPTRKKPRPEPGVL